MIEDDELLEKDNEIWEKVKGSLKREPDSKPVYNKIYLKNQHEFHPNKIPKEDSQYICLSVILIDSAFRTGKNYYPQVLEKSKYAIKE